MGSVFELIDPVGEEPAQRANLGRGDGNVGVIEAVKGSHHLRQHPEVDAEIDLQRPLQDQRSPEAFDEHVDIGEIARFGSPATGSGTWYEASGPSSIHAMTPSSPS